MNRRLSFRTVTILLSVIFSSIITLHAQRVSDFRSAVDSVALRMEERTGVAVNLGLKSISVKGTKVDFRFSETLGDFPWRKADVEWFKQQLKDYFPPQFSHLSVGNLYCKSLNVDELVVAPLGNDGEHGSFRYRVSAPKIEAPIVRNTARPVFDKGLQNRHIALWQSHGRYFEQKLGRWEWQRANLFQTVEDVFTQSFVLPFLVPMLENAGAYVFMPRERDTRPQEAIVDNDPYFSHEGDEYEACLAGMRTHGSYAEKGKWTTAGEGFADAAPFMYSNENFFTLGTARRASCVRDREHSGYCEATWTPDIEESGDYAVYVSYKTLPESTSAAHYSVHHAGGCTDFLVNQKIGGGTWIYLGTFRFEKGGNGHVTLDNVAEGASGKLVTADAVKFGGGMGNVARRDFADPDSKPVVSGLPRYLEGARYWEQWSGVDSTVYSQNAQADDYRDDFMSRGAWTGWLSGGSSVNPDAPGKGIPLDLSFAWHSDAGTFEDDTLVGTLAIYTLLCENSRKLPNGEDRMTCRDYADIVQSQITDDLQAAWDPSWPRRQIWNRSYSESRTPAVPAMLLELLSHQNFSDMKFGLDPEFRFFVARSVYKGMLKYLSRRYGVPYVVQPLPVNSFCVRFKDASTAELSWHETADTLEPTASATAFRLYTRKNGGVFDYGKEVNAKLRSGRWYIELPVSEDTLYAYRITAINAGGESFPSSVMCIGRPHGSSISEAVAVVDNFDRIAPPAWYDGVAHAGFDNNLDCGVAWGVETSFIGSQYDNRRQYNPWVDDDSPGFGASYQDWAGRPVMGNNFDNVASHASILMASGRPVCSFSMDAFSDKALAPYIGNYAVADIVCGRQATTPKGLGRVQLKYSVFPEKFRNALDAYTSSGGSLLVSGSHIGTDLWSSIYSPSVPFPSTEDPSVAREFVERVLGYKWMTNFASRTAQVWAIQSRSGYSCPVRRRFGFEAQMKEDSVFAGSPDGIFPAADGAKTVFRYSDTNISAAVAFDAGSYRTISVGFPIETVTDSSVMTSMLVSAIDWLFER